MPQSAVHQGGETAVPLSPGELPVRPWRIPTANRDRDVPGVDPVVVASVANRHPRVPAATVARTPRVQPHAPVRRECPIVTADGELPIADFVAGSPAVPADRPNPSPMAGTQPRRLDRAALAGSRDARNRRTGSRRRVSESEGSHAEGSCDGQSNGAPPHSFSSDIPLSISRNVAFLVRSAPRFRRPGTGEVRKVAGMRSFLASRVGSARCRL